MEKRKDSQTGLITLKYSCLEPILSPFDPSILNLICKNSNNNPYGGDLSALYCCNHTDFCNRDIKIELPEDSSSSEEPTPQADSQSGKTKIVV